MSLFHAQVGAVAAQATSSSSHHLMFSAEFDDLPAFEPLPASASNSLAPSSVGGFLDDTTDRMHALEQFVEDRSPVLTAPSPSESLSAEYVPYTRWMSCPSVHEALASLPPPGTTIRPSDVMSEFQLEDMDDTPGSTDALSETEAPRQSLQFSASSAAGQSKSGGRKASSRPPPCPVTLPSNQPAYQPSSGNGRRRSSTGGASSRWTSQHNMVASPVMSPRRGGLAASVSRITSSNRNRAPSRSYGDTSSNWSDEQEASAPPADSFAPSYSPLMYQADGGSTGPSAPVSQSGRTQRHASLNNNGLKKKRRSGNLPKTATNLLKLWLQDHLAHPYPTDKEKKDLAVVTKLLLPQINDWFINARRRLVPKMLKEADGKFYED